MCRTCAATINDVFFVGSPPSLTYARYPLLFYTVYVKSGCRTKNKSLNKGVALTCAVSCFGNIIAIVCPRWYRRLENSMGLTSHTRPKQIPKIQALNHTGNGHPLFIRTKMNKHETKWKFPIFCVRFLLLFGAVLACCSSLEVRPLFVFVCAHYASVCVCIADIHEVGAAKKKRISPIAFN